MKITICIPTLNPGVLSRLMVNALKEQSLQPDKILVIDSASTDGSIQVFEEVNANIISIERANFDHGGTRNLAFAKSFADVYVFLTQDAIPADRYALENLVNALIKHPACALVYGRQLPANGASAFARHARLYNYPPENDIVLKRIEDVPHLGIKAAFCSNSFAAYRRLAMDQIGFFSNNTLFAEDSIAAARLLQQGWQIGYVSNAVVTHSHDYTIKQDFCRYFDVGAFHSLNPWYMDLLGRVEGEGMRFVLSEYTFLKQQGVYFPIFKVILRNAVRWLGYRVGRAHSLLPLNIKLKFTTNHAYWKIH
jgi:rhamnosyltransferase